eukprot:5723908-Pyramimonas_sp.AAC.1
MGCRRGGAGGRGPPPPGLGSPAAPDLAAAILIGRVVGGCARSGAAGLATGASCSWKARHGLRGKSVAMQGPEKGAGLRGGPAPRVAVGAASRA